jgi:serpin B
MSRSDGGDVPKRAGVWLGEHPAGLFAREFRSIAIVARDALVERTMKTLLLAPALLATLVTACSSSSSTPSPSPGSTTAPNHGEAKSPLSRDTSPQLADAEKAAFAMGGYAIGADFVTKLQATQGASNLAVSPFSIAVAVSMPYAGAKGATATEMASALHWTMPQERVAPVYGWATLELAKRADSAIARVTKDAKAMGETAPDPSNFRLHVVNSVWADKNVTCAAPFLDTLAVSYGAGVTLADFVKNAEGERLAINQWVSDETQTRIKDLLPAGAIDGSTRMVLVNALHLKLPWADHMTTDSAPSAFTLAGGGTAQATYIRATESYPYYEDTNVTSVRVPLKAGEVSVLFVLPKGDLASFEGTLTGDALQKIHDEAHDTSVQVAVPKFRFETESLSLAEALQALGMKTAFQPGAADFTGIGQSDLPLYVGDVLHKAMIGLDEKGVEAAAATAVAMFGSAALPDEPKVFHADRPFLFAIIDEPTQSVLFVGHVVDPTK